MLFPHLLKGTLLTLSIIGTALSLPEAPRARESISAADTDSCLTDLDQPAEETIASLDTLPAMAIICASNDYWRRGDRLKAGFWLLVWEIRLAPWEASKRPGDIITENSRATRETQAWLDTDPMARVELARRAARYEARLPLGEVRPDHLTEAQWSALVAEHRQKIAVDLAGPAMARAEEALAKRRAQGQAVGAWAAPGHPLPDDWT